MSLTIDKVADAGLNKLNSIIKNAFNDTINNNLIDYTRPTRVEPFVLLDDSIMFSDRIDEVLSVMLNLFTSYYLQALAIDNAIGDITISQKLQKLNPNRSYKELENSVMSFISSNENYNIIDDKKCFSMSAANESLLDTYLPVLEANTNSKSGGKPNVNNTIVNSGIIMNTTVTQDDSHKKPVFTKADAQQLDNLCVGRIVDVEIASPNIAGKTYTIPISISLMVNAVPTSSLVYVLAGGPDKSFSARWHGWRSGRLKFWKDIVLCRDIIEAKKKNIINDKTGIAGYLDSRNNRNSIVGLLTEQKTISNISNIVVISNQAENELKQKMFGGLDNDKIRNKIFKTSGIIFLVVLDEEWNKVTIWTYGISRPKVYTFSQLRDINKKSDKANLMDMLLAFKSNNQPSL